MNLQRLKFEQLLYAIAFLLALAIRLAGASRLPLNSGEAELALQALGLARGEAAAIGPHPLYLVLTAALMFLFSAGDWAARFWPAVIGSLLVLLPALFRGRLGKLPALLLAFFLALDPGLLAVSRQAGSMPFALFFTVLALGLWRQQKTALAGIAAGMALISGPQVWPGLIGLGAAALLSRNLNGQAHLDGPVQDSDPAPEYLQPETGRRALLFCALTVFFAGTLLFTIPAGLSAMADSIPAYLRGWVAPANAGGTAGVTAGLLLIALLLYELFPLFFGIWGVAQGLLRRRASGGARKFPQVDQFLLAWFVIALALALVYPGRQVQDLCWALLPLWALAARQAARLVTVPALDRLPMVGHMVLTMVILGYILIAVIMASNGTITNVWEFRVRVAGAILMLVASTGLIAWGWSPVVSLRGFSWGIGIIALLLMISAGWNVAGLSGRGAELWSSGSGVRDADLLTGTFNDLADWNIAIVGGPDVVVVGEASPSLRWLLRDVRHVQYASQLPTDTSPALVITGAQPELALAATYRGQDLLLGESVLWSQFKQAEWLRWLVFRSAPDEAVRQDWMILWARADLFPGGLESLPKSNISGSQAAKNSD